MERTAFVTGATGFLGRHLIRELISQNWDVVAMCRSIPENAVAGANYLEADLSDAEKLLAIMPDTADAVFHTAADTNTWSRHNQRQHDTNVQGTANLIDAAIKRQVQRFLHVSSITTFGVDHQGLAELTERSPKSGHSSWVNYVKTKSLAEQLVRQKAENLNAIVLNPTHIIGPEDQHNWVRLFELLIKDELPAVPTGAGSFVDVRDVAKGCVQAADQGRIGQQYILGGHNLRFDQFIQQAANHFRIKPKLRRKPQWLLKAVAWWHAKNSKENPPLTPESLQLISHQYTVKSDKATKMLGYQIRSLHDSLRDIKADLKERGMLNA